jgi:hypothetical protein
MIDVAFCVVEGMCLATVHGDKYLVVEKSTYRQIKSKIMHWGTIHRHLGQALDPTSPRMARSCTTCTACWSTWATACTAGTTTVLCVRALECGTAAMTHRLVLGARLCVCLPGGCAAVQFPSQPSSYHEIGRAQNTNDTCNLPTSVGACVTFLSTVTIPQRAELTRRWASARSARCWRRTRTCCFTCDAHHAGPSRAVGAMSRRKRPSPPLPWGLRPGSWLPRPPLRTTAAQWQG